MIGVGQIMGLHRYALALALALAGGGAFAQSVAVQDSAFQRFLVNTTGVGQQTIGFTGSGQPVPQFSGGSLAGDGGPGLRASGTAVLRNPSGGQIPVSLVGRVTPQVLASFARRAVPLLGAAYLVSEVYSFLQEYGYQLTPSGPSFTVQKVDPTICTVAPCIEYNFGSGFRSTKEAACTLHDDTVADISGASYNPTTDRCEYTIFGGFGAATYTTQTVSPAPSAVVPSSLDALEAEIAADLSVPLSSSAARAILQARQLLNEPIPLAQPQVTGPSTSPGSTSTTTKADGSTVTITQTYNHSYTGPTISTTTTTVTSTVPARGGPVKTETTVRTPDPVQQEPEPFVMPCGVPGSPPCAVKVDETGVPTEVAELADTQDLADQSVGPIDGVEDPSFWPSLPDVSFDFALPTACSPLSIPAFSPFLEQIDVCEFQPMFHSIMELVWVLGALFGAISLFWRNSMNPVPA